MAPGSYTFSASTSFDGKAQTATGRFSVENIQLELNNLTAQHNILKSLSIQNGGSYFHHSDFKGLGNEILESNKIKPTLYSSIRTQMLLEKKWFFFLLLFLLGLEWFLRRYFGSY
jgi:ABC-type lipoprotein release transport system permease subunit